MNRSVLLVVCDFLILTLLSFVRFDSPPASTTEEPEIVRDVSAPAMSNMVATLEAALEAERQRREVLTNALAAQSAELEQRLRMLSEREQHLSNIQQRLEQSESEARALAEERARLERSQQEALASVQALHRAFEVTQRGTESLQERLTDTTREAAEAKARLEAMEEELKRRREEAEEMQRRLAKLDETREALAQEKQNLMLELRESETEARYARREVTNLSQQLSVATTEKAELLQTAAHLATNVGVLSKQSSAIRAEIERQNEQASVIKDQLERQAEASTAIREQIERTTRLPANAIYGAFLTNRIQTVMTGTTRGAFGQEVVRRRDAGTVLVRSGGRVFAILHVDSVPLRIWPPDAPWTGFSAELSHGNAAVRPLQFELLRRDPRIVIIPVDASMAERLGVAIYEAATDASEFGEAVVVGGDKSYYGESRFQLKGGTPGYVEMERSTFRRLFGEFSPRKGDLAFTKTGLFLGILVNGDHCILLNDLETLPPFLCGERLDPEVNSAILRTAQATLQRQPYALR